MLCTIHVLHHLLHHVLHHVLHHTCTAPFAYPQVVDPKTGAVTSVVVSADDGIRGDVTLQSLGALKVCVQQFVQQ